HRDLHSFPTRRSSDLEALRKFAGHGANGGGEVAGITAAERIDKIGNMSALAIMEASETTAKDIEEAGQAALDIAADLMKEAQQLDRKSTRLNSSHQII